jgi:hypothetical protein
LSNTLDGSPARPSIPGPVSSSLMRMRELFVDMILGIIGTITNAMVVRRSVTELSKRAAREEDDGFDLSGKSSLPFFLSLHPP